ncbi:MAG: HAD-IA family hydrolase [Chloroflexi bacterium]|nr:HAD-IA family hydrolase [Anaerolineaceae bacterium]NMB89755.1 HAD-IA family hydrolase [Chloroflexota bacterium]
MSRGDLQDTGRRFDYVIFDLGSTLIYFEGEWPDVFSRSNQVLLKAVQTAGFQVDADRFAADFEERSSEYRAIRDTEHIENSMDQILRTLLAEYGYPDLPAGQVEALLDEMYAVSQVHWRLEEDAHATLETLRRGGYHLGLISNAAYEKDVHVLIDQAGLRPFFDAILVSAGVGVRKPHPLIFHKMLEYWDARPEQAVMVGDTLTADVLGAQQLGMGSVWITRRIETRYSQAGAEKVLPDATIRTLSELPEVLRNWGQAAGAA